MRRWVLLILAASLALFAIAAVRAFRSEPQSVDDVLRRLSDSHPYYLGRTFESLPITRIQHRGELYVFRYGDCKKRCVQLQQEPLEGHNPVAYLRKRKTLPCTQTTVRGAPAARFEGLEVYTGDRTVSLFARTRAEELRMAAALQRLGEPTPRRLPAPVEDLTRGLSKCSGSFPAAGRG